MTARRDPDRLIATWLTETAPESHVDYLDETLEGIEAIHQRPAWAIPGRWIPMQTTLQRVALPRFAPILAILVLVLLAAIAALAIAGSRHRLAPPFGLAATGLVAFESNGDILATAADGSGRRTLVDSAGAQWSAEWSHGGDRIAYWSAPTTSAAASLWVAGSDGSNPHLVTGTQTFVVADALPSVNWSPDDKQLAFASDSGDLYVVNADGTNLRRIGDDTYERFDPVWSPDGALIAYRGQPQGDPASTTSSRVITPDGRTDQEVIPAEGGYEVANVNPSWSRDGRSFLVHTGGRFQGADVDISIAQRAADGAWSHQVIVAGPTGEFFPAWSNAGAQFSFIRSVSGTNPEEFELMVANAGGSNVRQVSSVRVGFGPQCWSPDDRFIRAPGLQDTGAARTILLIPLDGTPVVEIPAPGDASKGVCQMQRLAP